MLSLVDAHEGFDYLSESKNSMAIYHPQNLGIHTSAFIVVLSLSRVK